MPSSPFKVLGLATELGFTIAVPLVFFAIAGRFLDKELGTSPWLLLVGIICAINASSFIIYRKIKKII